MASHEEKMIHLNSVQFHLHAGFSVSSPVSPCNGWTAYVSELKVDQSYQWNNFSRIIYSEPVFFWYLWRHYVTFVWITDSEPVFVFMTSRCNVNTAPWEFLWCFMCMASRLKPTWWWLNRSETKINKSD